MDHTLKVARRIRRLQQVCGIVCIYCLRGRDTGRRPKLGGVFDHLPDWEIACDDHKREHKRRTDDASVGERKSVTTCLTAIYHICLHCDKHSPTISHFFKACSRRDRATKPKDRDYILLPSVPSASPLALAHIINQG